MLTGVIAGVAALAVVLIAATATGPAPTSSQPTAASSGAAQTNGTTGSSGPDMPSSPTAAALGPNQQTFVTDMRSTYGFDGDDDQTIVTLGTEVCSERQAGQTPAQVATAIKSLITGSDQTMGIVRLAEKDLCASYYTAPQVVFTVSGKGSPDITYGSDSDNRQGSTHLPFSKSLPLNDNALYYVVTAQLMGSGDITCTVTIDGAVVAKGHASGGYNICSAQAGKGLTGDWEQE